jgi:hypothetical protein
LQKVDPKRLTNSVSVEPQCGQESASETNRCGGAIP